MGYYYLRSIIAVASSDAKICGLGSTAKQADRLIESIAHCRDAKSDIESRRNVLNGITETRRALEADLKSSEVLLQNGYGVVERIETLPNGIRISHIRPLPSGIIDTVHRMGAPASDQVIIATVTETDTLEARILTKEDTVKLLERSNGNTSGRTSGIIRKMAFLGTVSLGVFVEIITGSVLDSAIAVLGAVLAYNFIFYLVNEIRGAIIENRYYGKILVNTIPAGKMLERIRETENLC